MGDVTNFLVSVNSVKKLHENMLRSICAENDLNYSEAAVICFLFNNPEKDTAADIVELRKLSKTSVSQAVESLQKRNFLVCKRDEKDRRRIHLALSEDAVPVIKSLDEAQKNFYAEIFNGFTDKEIRQFRKINAQIAKNAERALRGCSF